MEIDSIITLEDKDEYIILDKIAYEGNNYLYCVGIDKDENILENYEFFKESKEGEDYFIEEITDHKILDKIVELFTNIHLKNEEQDV